MISDTCMSGLWPRPMITRCDTVDVATRPPIVDQNVLDARDYYQLRRRAMRLDLQTWRREFSPLLFWVKVDDSLIGCWCSDWGQKKKRKEKDLGDIRQQSHMGLRGIVPGLVPETFSTKRRKRMKKMTKEKKCPSFSQSPSG